MHDEKREAPMGNAVGTAYYILHESDDEIYNATRRCNLIFERKVWGGLSHMSRDFVRRLLSKDAPLRLTAEEALQHPWILNHCS